MKLAWLPASLLVSLPCVAQTPVSGIVEGRVVHSVTGAGISGASVGLISTSASGNRPRYETTSDGAGYFKISVPPGSYRAAAEKDGFAVPRSDLASQFMIPELRVVAGDPTRTEIKLAPLSTIAGRVLGPDGSPVSNVQVSLSPNIAANETLTDQEGRFALENTRPGPYLLIAMPAAGGKVDVTSTGTRIAMVTTYFPAAVDRLFAQEITAGGVGDGGRTYEIRMQAEPVFRIRGIVVDAEGKPSPRADVALLAPRKGQPEFPGLFARGGHYAFVMGTRPSVGGTSEATAVTGDDGRFEFPAVRSGDWHLRAEPDHGQSVQRGSAAVVVTRGDLEGVEIRVAEPLLLKASVELSLELMQRPESDPSLFAPIRLIHPDSNEFASQGYLRDNILSFEDVSPGRYKALVRPGLAARIYVDGNEYTGTFLVQAGRRLHVALRTWAGAVKGTVENCRGATVILIPQRIEGPAYGHSMNCRADGSFDMNEVSPGDYYIAAVAGGTTSASPAAVLNAVVPSRGASVRVEEGSVVTVRLSVTAP